MKRFTLGLAATGLLLAGGLVLVGCGQPSVGGDRMGSDDHKMSAMEGTGDHMSDGKMSDGKMSDGKMTDGKM